MLHRVPFRLIAVIAVLGTLGPASAEAAGIASGETRSGLLLGGTGGNNREETWTFTGSAGDRVVVATAQDGSGGVQPEIVLAGPGPAPAIASATGSFSMFRLTHQLPADGEYTITVRDNGANNDGYYSIAFTNVSAAAIDPGLLASAVDPDGGPVSSGQSVGGSITGNADMDCFQFDGSPDDRIVVTVSGSGPQPELYLFPPGGGGPAADFPGTGNLSTRRVDYRLGPAAGGTKYTLLVSDYGMNNYGSYTLSFAKIPGDAASATDGDGGPIASGETKLGYLSPAVDSDLFQFAATAGDRIVITTAPLSGSGVQPEFYLYPPAGGALEASSLGSTSGHLLDAVAAASGTYTILVSDYGLNAEGWYSLSLAKIPGAAASADDADGGIIASGETKLGYLSNRSDTDIFQFDAQGGEMVILTTAENTGGVQPEIRFYAPDGSFVAQAIGSKDSQWLEQRLPAQSGTYTAVVSDFNLDAEGWYAIALVTIPGAVTSAGDADGGTIMSGGTKAGVLSYQADTDVYLFYGTAGTTVAVAASSPSSGLEPQIRLYAPGGNLEQSSLPVTRATRENWQLQETGVYSVVISDAGLNASGTYAFSLVQIPGGISPSDNADDNDGGMIAHKEVKVGAFHYGADQDVYHFYGRPGDRITLTAAAYAYSSVQPEIYLYPPGGGAIEASATGSLMPQKLSHTLLQRGLYTLVVSDNNLDSTGYYSVVFSTSAASPAPGIYNAFPPQGSSVVTSETKFMWDAVAGATGYELYYGTDPLAPLTLLDTIATNSRIFPEKVAGNTYYWRVVALTPGGPVPGPFTWFSFIAAPIIHRDDFTDGSDAGDPDWLPYRYASWRVNSAKQLASTANVDNRVVNNNFSAFLTGKFEIKTKLSGGGSAANASLLFAYQSDHQRYRYVKLLPGRIVVGQAGYLGTEAGGIKKTIFVPTVVGRWYRLRADLDSAGYVRVYLDGRLKGAFKFKRAVAGWLGLGASQVETFFDNFYCEEATVFP
ncbi:MAG TPA: hypothetical protein VI078_00550 [bacterium]